MRIVARKNVLRLVLCSFTTCFFIFFFTHHLRDPDLSVLPDPSEFFIYKNQVTPVIDEFIHNHQCADHKFVIVVETSPGNFKQRNIIRSTYGDIRDQKKFKYQVFFALAASSNATLMTMISNENAVNEDIIQWNFLDSYKNLVIKSTVIIKWATTHCSSSSFIVKADDDVYINIYNLLGSEKLHWRLGQEKRLIFGRGGNVHPARNHQSKWYIPRTVYLNDTFPKFVTGVAYILSTSSCNALYKSILDSFPLLINEDVVVTGIAAEKAGIVRLTDQDEPLLKTYYLNEILDLRAWSVIDAFYKVFPDRTDLRSTFYIGHYLNKEQFDIIHTFVKKNQYFTINDLKRILN